ncbi:MAG TPA: hypothetical protein VMQ62_00890, partial [Dongiaceae bacterium]|nr:hypothetical protein [Dongiaceae bacterium]
GLGGAGSFAGGALPPPKPATGTFDDKSPSEPPIGWPIVGVISRADARLSDKTYKVYKGHDKVNQWQFHVFDQTLEAAVPNALPGGSQAPFSIGPGFGGRGKIWGTGGGPGGGGGGGRTQTPLGSPWAPQGGGGQRNSPGDYGGNQKPKGGG